MAFVPPKPAGWGTDEKLTSAQMNALQANIAAADAQTVNGVTGGVYTPGAPVDIQRLAGRVRASETLLLDHYESLQVAGEAVSFEHSMVPRFIDPDYALSTFNVPTWQCTTGSAGGCVSWLQYNATQPFGIHFALPLPEGATLNEVGFTLESSAHTLVPATQPAFFIRKHVRSTGVSSNIFSGNDTAALAAYNTRRTYQANAAAVSGVVTNLLPYVGEAGCHYSLSFHGESGANSIAGLTLHGIYATIVVRRFEPLGRL